MARRERGDSFMGGCLDGCGRVVGTFVGGCLLSILALLGLLFFGAIFYGGSQQNNQQPNNDQSFQLTEAKYAAYELRLKIDI